VLADLFPVDNDVIEISERRDNFPVAAGERRLTGPGHRSGAIDRMRGLIPAVRQFRDRAVPAGRTVEEIGDELRIDQRHVTGNNEDITLRIERA
jgi:hypothetical protein